MFSEFLKAYNVTPRGLNCFLRESRVLQQKCSWLFRTTMCNEVSIVSLVCFGRFSSLFKMWDMSNEHDMIHKKVNFLDAEEMQSSWLRHFFYSHFYSWSAAYRATYNMRCCDIMRLLQVWTWSITWHAIHSNSFAYENLDHYVVIVL